jgi:hypothetical protein
MVNPNRFYTYAYLREDKTPYYIGKGTNYRAFDRKRKGIKPPSDKSKIILLKKNLTEEESFRHEIYMIAVFGRKDLGTGILQNKTNGGDGPSGIIPWNKGKTHSEETKKKIKEKRALQTISQETREKMSISRRGEKHPLYGRGHTEETKKKLSNSKKGKKLSLEHKNKVAESVLKRTSKTYEVTFPDGKVEIFYNLVEISRKYANLKLDSGRLSKLALGKIESYKNVRIKILENNG